MIRLGVRNAVNIWLVLLFTDFNLCPVLRHKKSEEIPGKMEGQIRLTFVTNNQANRGTMCMQIIVSIGLGLFSGTDTMTASLSLPRESFRMHYQPQNI